MSQKLATSIRRIVGDHAEAASGVVQLGRVTNAVNLTVELFESGVTLHADELDLDQATRAYHRDTGVAKGDTVVVARKATGGEIHWLVIGVIADTDPKLAPPPPPPTVPVTTYLPFRPSNPVARADGLVLFSRVIGDNWELRVIYPDGTVQTIDTAPVGP